MTQQFWAITYDNGKQEFGPFQSREQALAAALATKPARDVLTGYGADSAWFDLRWHRQADWRWRAAQTART